MDGFSLVLMIIGGAIGGGLGTFFSRKIKNRSTQRLVMVIPILVSMQIFSALAKSNQLRDFFVKPKPIELLFRQLGENLQQNEKFKAAVKDMDGEQVSAFTQEKAKLGIRRLPFPELSDWNQLRLQMAESNEALCAGFWTGQGTTPEDLVKALESLPSQEAAKWFQLSANAIVLELDDAKYPAPTKNDIQIGFQEIAKVLSKSDADRFGIIMISGTKAAAPDACWAAKTLFSSVGQLPDSAKEPFLRALAASL